MAYAELTKWPKKLTNFLWQRGFYVPQVSINCNFGCEACVHCMKNSNFVLFRFSVGYLDRLSISDTDISNWKFQSEICNWKNCCWYLNEITIKQIFIHFYIFIFGCGQTVFYDSLLSYKTQVSFKKLAFLSPINH